MAPDFTKHEAAVFTVEGFKPRMDLIKELVRPKLAAAGAALAPRVAKLTGHEMFPHVAKHARRTVNPPAETWCAFARDKRGYKKHVHYALAISSGGVHARVVLKEEAAPERKRLATKLAAKAKAFERAFERDAWLRDYRDWDHGELPALATTDVAFFKEQARVLALKSGTLDLGYGFPIGDGPPSDDEVIAAFERLLPIYEAAAD